jgi:hypothetical protein
MSTIAALIFILTTGFVVLFQLALVAGAPWGEWTMGGRWRGALPLSGRLIAGFSALLLLSFIIVIAARAQLGFLSLQGYAPIGTWVVVAYCALGCVANAATTSKRERRLWLPVVACMLAASLTVALS